MLLRRLMSRSLVGALVVAGLTVLPTQSATAAPACGVPITSSVKLTANLHCPGGDGLVIGANNVVVNLNGKTVSGTGSGSGVVANGRWGVHVYGGVIAGFGDGIHFDNADYSSIKSLRVMDSNGVGIHLVAGSNHNSISFSTVTRSLGRQIHLEDSTHNRLTGLNLVKGGSDGVNFNKGAGYNSLTGSSISYHVGDGIKANGDANTFRGNTVHAATTGILIWEGASGVTVEGNTVTKASANGIYNYQGESNTVRGNKVGGSGANGIASNEGAGNTIAGNAVKGSQEHGFQVFEEATMLNDNTSTQNAIDGFRVSCGGTCTLTGNAATYNTQKGINATGEIDGGGNTASGNGGGDIFF